MSDTAPPDASIRAPLETPPNDGDGVGAAGESGTERSSVADAKWYPWRVAPDSGFQTRDSNGNVGLRQRNEKEFDIEHEFRFDDDATVADLIRRLEKKGLSPEAVRKAVNDARKLTPTQENPTDLASVPFFMRWFASPYGVYTLAAIIHDDLITNKRDGGVLGSDTLSDRFFRKMLQSAGVPWLKRWIMWAGVAFRTRWHAGVIRGVLIVVWVILAVVGITSLVGTIPSAVAGWGGIFEWKVLLLIALGLPWVASVLWWKQYGAGIVAAAAALWILPAAVLAGFGYLVYLLLERIGRGVKAVVERSQGT